MNKEKKDSYFVRLRRDLKKYKSLYILAIPVVVYFILFHYKPMYGLVIAFQNYRPGLGISGSKWVGLQHFEAFFGSFYFKRTLKNTLIISFTTLIVSFPAPIIFALLLNEVKNMKFKRMIQTISYMPHFISTVVICGLITTFTSNTGVLTTLAHNLFGFPKISMLTKSELFVPIYVISGIWQSLGWDAIIYISALSSVDQQLYEAAEIDGANRWKQTIHVTIPSIAGTIIILLLMRLGSIMNVGFEKIIMLYNESIYDTSDVIATFVYRRGLKDAQYSFGAAVGLFNSVVNFFLVIIFNKISKKVTEISLW